MSGTGIAGAMDYVPSNQPTPGKCWICNTPFKNGASYAARVLPPLVQVCSHTCANNPRFSLKGPTP